jgi:hypothetical protein
MSFTKWNKKRQKRAKHYEKKMKAFKKTKQYKKTLLRM